MTVATPGTTNDETFAYGVCDVDVSHARGFYTNTFDLTLTASVPGSTIRYTTDGSKPTASSGGVYTDPIPIEPRTGGGASGTRCIRAIAWHDDAARTPVSTHTYLFINGVAGPAADGVVGQSVLVSCTFT